MALMLNQLEYSILLSVVDGSEPFDLVYKDAKSWLKEFPKEQFSQAMFSLQGKKLIELQDMGNKYEPLDV